MSGLPSAPDVGFDCYLIQVIKKLVNPLFCRYKLLNLHVVSGVVVHAGLCEHLICCTHSSEEVSLAHDAHEFLFGDLAVTVAICLLDHFSDLIVCHVLTELLGNALEISE